MALRREACQTIAAMMGQGVWTLTGGQVRQLQGAYVYQWVRGEDSPEATTLYVGLKTAGETRPFNPDHHRMGLGADVRRDDHLHIYPMPTPEIARWFEAVAIQWMRPAYNRQVPQPEAVPDTPTPPEIEYVW